MGVFLILIIGIVTGVISRSIIICALAVLITTIIVGFIKSSMIYKCGSSNLYVFTLYNIASRAVKLVMEEYRKNNNSSCSDPVLKTISTFYVVDSIRPDDRPIMLTNLEGLCYMMAWKNAGSNIMAMRLAQLISFVNISLAKYPDKPFISEEDKYRIYEILKIDDLPSLFPQLNL